MIKEKELITVARAVSTVFNPFYLPMVGLIALFFFSYLKMLPTFYKATVLVMVYVFTALLPTLLIRFYRNTQGWSLFELGARERRMVPYVIAILCYFICVYLMRIFHMPHFMGSILVAALLIQVVCALINIWWKISTHSAAIGGVAGALLAFAMIFTFNPMWWFCLVMVLSGAVGTSRMILRQHSLSQVVVGFGMGLVVSFFAILL